MRIAFVLPERSPVPIGGFAVVYEYATRLTERGHRVAIVHPRTVRPPRGIVDRLKAEVWMRRYRHRPRQLAPWFPVPAGVELIPSRHIGDRLPAADVLIATTWDTAAPVLAATSPSRRGFYFIQGYDVWFADEADVLATWQLPLHKIVISRWLEEKAIEVGEGERTSRVPIGLDAERWGVDVPPAGREPRIGALLSSRKGREDVLAALAAARVRIPDLRASCFGTEPPPADLPPWIDYTPAPGPPELRRLYNSCAVFLQASREEGWGLPAVEAMACGCALVTYDTGGSREFAVDGETAAVVPTGDTASMGAAAAGLVEDAAARLEMVARGRERVAEFGWPRSVDRFEEVLTGAGAAG